MKPGRIRLEGLIAAVSLFLLAGCEGRQSALSPTGEDATTLALIFFVMLGVAVPLWFALNGLFHYVTRINPLHLDETGATWFVIIGGIALPALLVGALLAWGLSILPDQRRPGDGLTIRVTGEQWWWRVEYLPANGDPVISANEMRMPVGERVEFRLGAKRVIHSFWIPALGGKMDMFPGRETRVSLKATELGVYRGQCAEFCGISHAWMAFETVAMPPEDFAAWLEAERADALPPEGPEAQAGAGVFAREGCGACHTIRGTDHVGQVGPDLTHFGSRQSLGAGRLGTSPEDLAAWIAHTDELKPGVDMPAYDHLGDTELASLAAYLKGLE